MSHLKYYKRNGYEFQIVERTKNVARAIGRKGKRELHDVLFIIPFDGNELQCPLQGISTFSTESQAIEKFNELTQ